MSLSEQIKADERRIAALPLAVRENLEREWRHTLSRPREDRRGEIF